MQELFQGTNQTHLLKLIDVFIIHHFEMILASAWPNISLHLSNGNRGSSGLASAPELEQKGPILSPSKYIMNGLATEKKEYSTLSQESIYGTTLQDLKQTSQSNMFKMEKVFSSSRC